MEKTLFKYYLILMVSASSCVKVDESKLSNTVMTSQNDGTILGQAYSSDQERMILNTCVEGTEVFQDSGLPAPSAEVSYPSEREKTPTVMQPMGSNDPKNKYDLITRNLDDERVYRYKWSYVPKKKAFAPNTLKIKPAALTYQASDRISKCGDQFVSEIFYGISLEIDIRIKLKLQEKEEKSDRSGGGATSQFYAHYWRTINELNEKNQIVSIKISASQAGGEEQKLSESIGVNLIQCDTNSFNKCMDIIKKADEYTKTVVQQVTSNPEKLNPVEYKLEKYERSDANGLVPHEGYLPLSPEIISGREKARDLYVTADDFLEKIDEFEAGLPVDHNNPEQTKRVHDVKISLLKFKSIYELIVTQCFEYVQEIVEVENTEGRSSGKVNVCMSKLRELQNASDLKDLPITSTNLTNVLNGLPIIIQNR